MMYTPMDEFREDFQIWDSRITILPRILNFALENEKEWINQSINRSFLISAFALKRKLRVWFLWFISSPIGCFGALCLSRKTAIPTDSSIISVNHRPASRTIIVNRVDDVLHRSLTETHATTSPNTAAVMVTISFDTQSNKQNMHTCCSWWGTWAPINCKDGRGAS